MRPTQPASKGTEDDHKRFSRIDAAVRDRYANA
jgi:hypothetical protein